MRLGADALGDREGALEEAFELARDGADLAGDCVGLLDLAEDLRLTDDHGVEGAGDTEEVADGLALAELVEVRADGGGGDGEVLVEEAEEVGGGFVLEGEEFDAVAGGEDEALADAGLVEKGTGGIGEASGGDGEALADLDGGGGVVDAEEYEIRRAHTPPNLWTAENWFAAQTVTTTKKTKVER